MKRLKRGKRKDLNDMEGFVLISTFVLGIIAGYSLQSVILPALNIEDWLKNRSIQKKFSCKKNDYTFFEEGIDDFYILTINNKERRIKFSKNRPYTIVYDREVDMA